jgi:DNA-binding MarR family transcriptional regulator
MDQKEHFLESCLFFNTNTLSRYLLKIAEKQFKPLKLSPAHASLLLLVYDNPDISSKDLAAMMHLTPSTITRFVDVLVKKKLVRRKLKGKTTTISATEKGAEIKKQVAVAYKKLYLKYTAILGEETANTLSFSICQAYRKLDRHIG